MKRLFFCISLFLALHGYAQKFQLAPPRIHYTTVFFKDSSSVPMSFNQPGTAIRYTTDGSEPNLHSPVYTTPLVVTKNTTLRAISTGDSFSDSEPVIAHFIKAGLPVKKIDYTPPHEVYAGSARDILLDGKGGIPNFRNGQWLGYTEDTAVFTLYLHKKETINEVVLNLLKDENSWIFLPEQVLVWYFDSQQKIYVPCGKRIFSIDKEEPRQCVAAAIALEMKEPVDHLRIMVIPTPVIPEWHPGKGSKAWLFVDEINVY